LSLFSEHLPSSSAEKADAKGSLVVLICEVKKGLREILMTNYYLRIVFVLTFLEATSFLFS